MQRLGLCVFADFKAHGDLLAYHTATITTFIAR